MASGCIAAAPPDLRSTTRAYSSEYFSFLNDFHNCLVLHELSVEKRKIQSLLNKIEKRKEKSSSLASDPLQSFDKHMYWTDQAAQARATLPLI